MIATILTALVVGLIVGALARLIMPGKQNIGVIMTVILGALGSFIGTWLTYSAGIQQLQRRVADHPVPRRDHRGDRLDRDLRRSHRTARWPQHHADGALTPGGANR